MLLSLQAGLHAELRSSISQLSIRIDHIEDSTAHLESQMSEVAKAHDELVNAHESQNEMIHKLQLKVADLEDRSRRNNIKLRGIPEIVKPRELVPYIHQLFLKLIPDLSPRDLLMDRAHRIPKPTYLPGPTPRTFSSGSTSVTLGRDS